MTTKRRDYANFRIPEYWRFDPTGIERYGEPIAGDRLVDDAYSSIEILEIEPDHFHGHSDVLNLDLCWDHGKLRWFDPAPGQHLLLVAEELNALAAERQARIAAEARVRELEDQLRAREER